MRRWAAWASATAYGYLERYRKVMRILPHLPIAHFYRYLWENDKTLLLKSLLINYVLPLLLELLPFWWLSRTRLLIEIRKARVGINFAMQTNLDFNRKLIRRFLVLNLLYTLIATFVEFYKDRVALELRFAIRRLVLDRILHSDLESFEDLRDKTVDRFLEVSKTLSFVNFTLPAVLSCFYKLYLEGHQLWLHRNRIDQLLLLYPILTYVARITGNRLQDHFMHEFTEAALKKKKKKRNQRTTEFLSNLIDGLVDIQINNLQDSQLDRLDVLIDDEMSDHKGMLKFFDETLECMGKQNVLEFVSESYVVHTIMRRKNIEFDQYLIVQGDLNHALQAVRQLLDLKSVVKKEYDRQKKLRDIVNLPYWKREAERTVEVEEFHTLHLKDIKFSYKNSKLPVLEFDEHEMLFEAGKTYGIVGQNMAGKSTLAHIICKLYEPQEGEILLNGIPYEHIGRECLRDMISYASQNLFIFPGTIRDNIKIGNPNASDEEVLQAALSAGVLSIGSSPQVSPRKARRAMRQSTKEINQQIKLRFQQQEDEERESRAVEQNSGGESRLPRSSLSKSAHAVPFVPPLSLPGRSGTPVRFDPEACLHRTRELKQTSDDLRLDFSPARLTRSLPITTMADIDLLHTVLDTEVTNRGKNLSGGLLQSVALARVYVRPQAKIIILDESIGQMDNFKKRTVIFPYLFDFVEKHNMTLIMISHDMHDVKDLDHIYVMDEGEVVHQGTHQELLRENAVAYMQLLNSEN